MKQAILPCNGLDKPFGPLALEFARQVGRARKDAAVAPLPASTEATYPHPKDFLQVTVDKFVFRIPSDGFLFNENDCWVQAICCKARVGVSDFVQQNMTDITWFEPPEVGAVVEQFGELGVIESSKAVMEIISPVSGRIIAINNELRDKPEWVNEDPYGKGWVAELELTNFMEDLKFLIGPEDYARIVEKKAAESVSKH